MVVKRPKAALQSFPPTEIFKLKYRPKSDRQHTATNAKTAKMPAIPRKGDASVSLSAIRPASVGSPAAPSSDPRDLERSAAIAMTRAPTAGIITTTNENSLTTTNRSQQASSLQPNH